MSVGRRRSTTYTTGRKNASNGTGERLNTRWFDEAVRTALRETEAARRRTAKRAWRMHPRARRTAMLARPALDQFIGKERQGTRTLCHIHQSSHPCLPPLARDEGGGEEVGIKGRDQGFLVQEARGLLHPVEIVVGDVLLAAGDSECVDGPVHLTILDQAAGDHLRPRAVGTLAVRDDLLAVLGIP